MEQDKSKSGNTKTARWPTRLLIVASIFALLFSAVFLWFYRHFNDEYLANLITSKTNLLLRGRLELGRVHWHPRLLVDLALGMPTPITIQHFAVYDPRGKEVLFAPQATGKVELLTLIRRGHLIVHQMQVRGARCLV